MAAQDTNQYIRCIIQLLLFICAFVLGEILSLIIWLDEYHGILDVVTIPWIIGVVIIVFSIMLAMNLVNSRNYFLILGPDTEARWSFCWTLANFCRARTMVLPTTLWRTSFYVFIALSAFLFPLL